MSQGLKKIDLQNLALAKLADAILLLNNQRFSNAYYLAGYALELGLKACIAARMAANTIPDKNLVNRAYTHKLSELVGVAGLSQELQEKERTDPEFGGYWGIVGKWSTDSRYDATDLEPPRLSRRLHSLRGWSHEEVYKIFT